MITAPQFQANGMPPLWRISCALYHEMIEKGVLNKNHAVELIDGQLIAKMSIGPTHAGIVNRLNHLLSKAGGNTAIISVQNPITINEYSEPEPDVVVAKYRDDFYSTAHPGPDDILLVIEVADSSVVFDRNAKIPLYAACDIQEAWLVDLTKREVQVYRKPEGASYTEQLVAKAGDHLPVPGSEGATIEVAKLGL